MSDSPDDIPTFEELAADPEIAALLDFEPVPRQVTRPNGWTPERQRLFIARLAHFGVPKLAADSMSKNVSGVTALYRQNGTESFRAAWDGAIELNLSRRVAETGSVFIGDIPGIASRHPENRLNESPRRGEGSGEGQALNEHGEWEDEGSLRERIEDARDSIAAKLLNCRRLYLQEISASPGKRAAFEILTDLPIDWDKAARLEPQDDEPWARPNMREPDMLLTAEAGWMGHMARGRDKVAELRRAIDLHREQEGLPAVEWGEDESPSPLAGEGGSLGEPGEGASGEEASNED